MRNLVRLAVLLLIAHALYRFVPVYIHYYQFKDAVAETALFSKDRTDTELVDRVMALAARYQIPIERDAVQVSRDTRMTLHHPDVRRADRMGADLLANDAVHGVGRGMARAAADRRRPSALTSVASGFRPDLRGFRL